MRQPTRLFDIPHYQLEHIPMKLMMTSKVGGEWKSYSTKEFTEAVDQASRALLELGVKAGDKVALISHNNRCEWNIMDHALLQIGAVDVPIYPTMTEANKFAAGVWKKNHAPQRLLRLVKRYHDWRRN